MIRSAIKEFVRTGIFNHSDEGRFTGAYYFNLEDIKPFMEAHGFKTIKLIGSSSIAGSFKAEQFDYWRSVGRGIPGSNETDLPGSGEPQHFGSFISFIVYWAETIRDYKYEWLGYFILFEY